ncbi:hypothetical protein M2336_001661 [Sphingobium sp. B1D7B]|uniref:hypothetical protein n=1 Tax=Sphingobium sp. B1D7B TaxID=2940578 RepID=UPI002225743B|nr:hypothetical protein [Sphingobium sp. B1D7B]MCW2405032.1 hypothetical protein [Sphingobium sp. B1D7B]
MGMFGNNPFSRVNIGGFTGQPASLGILSGDMPQMPQMPSQETPAMKGGGFFKSETGRAVLGGLFDSILTQTGGQAVNIPNMLQQRELARKQQLAETERKREWQDWLTKKEWERANPAPSEFERVLEWSGVQSGTPGWTESMQQRRDNLLDPIVNVPLPGGRVYLGPRSGLPAAAGAAAPTSPVGKLTPIGGPASAPAGFPGR